VIGFDHRDLASADRAKAAITAHLTQALDGAVDSPISTLLNLERLSRGTSAEKALAELAAQIEGLGGLVVDLHRSAARDRAGEPRGIDLAGAELVARLAVEAERRGFGVSFAESPANGPHVIVTVAVPDNDPQMLMLPFAHLTEGRVRNLFRNAERAARPDDFAPGAAPPEGWTHELPTIPREQAS
jgi:hypothetical protein